MDKINLGIVASEFNYENLFFGKEKVHDRIKRFGRVGQSPPHQKKPFSKNKGDGV